MMERRVLGNWHARCGAGENLEITSKGYLSLYIETNVRPYVIEYVKHKYGEESVSGIMTATFLTGKAALRTARSVYSIRTHNDSMYYAQIGDALSKKAEETNGGALGIVLKDMEKDLRQAFVGNKVANEIISYALLIENVCDHFGQHAAGIIVTDGKPVDNYVPLMQNKLTDMMVTQCDKIQAEKDGLLKIDFLGLLNLTIITETLQMIQKTTGQKINMDKIPYERKVFEKIFAEGMTNSVFQFESSGMKQMLKDFKPESIFDLTLLVAMYRPGPLQFLKDVIDVKNGRKELTYLTKELEPILSDTYGSITYQEQVQHIFRSLAGYSYGQADLVRRAMSKKEEEKLKAERQAFIYGDESRNIVGCIKNGISEDAASKLFEQMTEFAKYAFNKSHAACYAVVAYQTAWLKYYYPVQYMTAVMNNSDFKKYPDLIGDIKQMGIRLLPPDVNASGLYFTPESTTREGASIRYGLSKIKGVGEASVRVVVNERKNGAYKSLGDFMNRTMVDKKTYDALTDCGGFDCFTDNRAAVRDLQDTFRKSVKSLQDLQKKYDIESDQKKGEAIKERIDKLIEEMEGVQFSTEICENMTERLDKEKEVLGGYVSSHPLDLYPEPKAVGASDIASVKEMEAKEFVTLTGIVSDYKEKARKKDGAKLAFFTLTDKTGGVEVCVFSKAFEDTDEGVLKDGSVIKLHGKTMEDQTDSSVIKVSMDSAEILNPYQDVIILSIPIVVEWERSLRQKVLPYRSQNGNELWLYDECQNRYRRVGVRVSPDVLKIPGIKGARKKLRT